MKPTLLIVDDDQGIRTQMKWALDPDYEIVCNPIDVDELKLLLRRCVYVSDLEKGYREMQQKLRADIFENMLGTSSQMQGVFAFIRKVATTSAPVLLLGESGTGKEMAASAIHRCSSRKNGA